MVGSGGAVGWCRMAPRRCPSTSTPATALALAALAVLGGVGIDAFIFVQWVGGGAHTAGTQLAALAQALIISGVNLAFIAFLGAAPD